MRRFFNDYNLGLESEEIQAEQAAELQAEADGGADNLETELLEVADSAAEGEAREESIDEGVEVVEELEEDAEELAVAAENGGIDKYAASILARKVNLRLASIGFTPVRSIAVESFGSASSRQRQTVIAMEGIMDKARAVWEAIINAIKNAAKWIKGHFLKHFGAFEKLANRAKALQERAGNTTGKKQENNLENDRLANALHVGYAISADKVSSSLDAITNVIGSYKALESKVDSLVNTVDGITDQTGMGAFGKSAADVVGEIADKVGATTDIQSSEKDIKAPEGATGKKSAELCGGIVVCCYTADEGKSPAHNSVKVTKLNNNKNADGKRLPTLSTSEAENIAGLVESLADTGIKARSVLDNIAKQKDKLVKEVEKLAKEAGKHTDEDDATTQNQTERKNANSARRAAVAADKLVGNFPARFNDYAVVTAKAALDYVELSLRQYKAD